MTPVVLGWRGPAAIINDRPVLLSERVYHINKSETVSQKQKSGLGPQKWFNTIGQNIILALWVNSAWGCSWKVQASRDRDRLTQKPWMLLTSNAGKTVTKPLLLYHVTLQRPFSLLTINRIDVHCRLFVMNTDLLTYSSTMINLQFLLIPNCSTVS